MADYRGFCRLACIDPDEEQSWRRYGVHMLIFSPARLFLTYAILRLQGIPPLLPQTCRTILPA
jgi:K+-transporting ATPase ATPase A chain